MKTRKPRGRPFEKGNRASVGNKGGGRPPNYVKYKLRKIVENPKAFQFLTDAIEGKPVDVRMDNGKVRQIPATAAVRHTIYESCHDRVFGKPASVLDMGEGEELVIGIVKVPAKDLGKSGGVKDDRKG